MNNFMGFAAMVNTLSITAVTWLIAYKQMDATVGILLMILFAIYFLFCQSASMGIKKEQ